MYLLVLSFQAKRRSIEKHSAEENICVEMLKPKNPTYSTTMQYKNFKNSLRLNYNAEVRGFS